MDATEASMLNVSTTSHYSQEVALSLRSVGERLQQVCKIFEKRNEERLTCFFSYEIVREMQMYATRLLAAANAIETGAQEDVRSNINGVLVSLRFYDFCGATSVYRPMVHEDIREFDTLVREMNFLQQAFEELQRVLPDEDTKSFVHTILWNVVRINEALRKMHGHMSGMHSAIFQWSRP